MQDGDPTKLYELILEEGKGEFGTVYKALTKGEVKEAVAIKRIPVQIDSEDDTFIKLAQEIVLLEECDCPFIVSFQGSYIWEEEVWMVMEYMDAGTVAKAMATLQDAIS